MKLEFDLSSSIIIFLSIKFSTFFYSKSPKHCKDCINPKNLFLCGKNRNRFGSDSLDAGYYFMFGFLRQSLLLLTTSNIIISKFIWSIGALLGESNLCQFLSNRKLSPSDLDFFQGWAYR